MRAISAAVLGAAILVSVGCSTGNSIQSQQQAPSAITAVSLTCIPAQVPVGSSASCAAAVTGTGIFPQSITYTVSPTNLGSISALGVFTATALGTVIITVTVQGGVTKSATATVTSFEITDVNMSCESAQLDLGESTNCPATVSGEGEFSPSVVYTLEPPNLGSISPDGVFVAAAPGAVTITATATGDPTKSASETVVIHDATLERILFDRSTFLDTSKNGIFVADRDPSNVQKLMDGALPAWSPDHRQIAYLNGNPTYPYTMTTAMIVDADGTSHRRVVTNALERLGGISWSSDGKQLLITATRSNQWGVYIINADGSGLTPIDTTLYPQCIYEGGGRACTRSPGPARFSPDNQTVVFVSGRNCPTDLRDTAAFSTCNELYTVAIDGSRLTRLTDNNCVEGSPSFSNDGTQVLYDSSDCYPVLGEYHVMLTNADGSGNEHAVALGKSPAFSPDGSEILFVKPIYVEYWGPGYPHLYYLSGDGYLTVSGRPSTHLLGDHPSWR